MSVSQCFAVCVAVCCSVLQCVAVCCTVVYCDALCCTMLQCVAVCRSVSQCVAVCRSASQCVAVCRSVSQCVAVCCSSAVHTTSSAALTTTMRLLGSPWVSSQGPFNYGVATISRLLEIHIYVSFAKEPYKRDYVLQKRAIILRSLLLVAPP